MNKEAERALARDRLLKEGELYRISVLHAKKHVAQALRPDAMIHGAIDHAIGVVHQRFGTLLGPGGISTFNFRKLLPYAVSLGSFIVRRRLVKPALIVGALAAAGGTWMMRRKR
ncbi:MAG: hypothetical protein V4724_32770 [Pseudomonadota bacterium]